MGQIGSKRRLESLNRENASWKQNEKCPTYMKIISTAACHKNCNFVVTDTRPKLSNTRPKTSIISLSLANKTKKHFIINFFVVFIIKFNFFFVSTQRASTTKLNFFSVCVELKLHDISPRSSVCVSSQFIWKTIKLLINQISRR